MKKIDASGLSCPQPVLMTMQKIKNGEKQIQVIVDNNSASENVQRLAKNNNFDVKIEQTKEDNIILFLNKNI